MISPNFKLITDLERCMISPHRAETFGPMPLCLPLTSSLVEATKTEVKSIIIMW